MISDRFSRPVRRCVHLALALMFLPWSVLTLVAPQSASAAIVSSLVLNSNLAGNPHPIQSRWYSLRGYGAIRSDVNWPSRNEDCGGPFNGVSQKSLPWIMDYPGQGINGNTINVSDDCSTRYHDGGTTTNYGAWINDGPAQGAWSAAGVQTVNWNTVYPPQLPAIVIDNACNNLPTGYADPIWGTPAWDNSDQMYASGTIGTIGGTVPGLLRQNYPATTAPAGGPFLFSNGVTLFRQNFVLTAADWAVLGNPTKVSQASTEFELDAVADDWLRVYVNGVQTSAASTRAIGHVTLDLKSIVSLLKPPPQINTFGLMVADKGRIYPAEPGGRVAGVCYNLNLRYDNTPPVVERPGLQGYNGDVHAGGGVGDCAPAAGTGNIKGFPGANSMSQYVVSGLGNVSGFGSNNNAGNSLTLGGAGSYSILCRPDILTSAQDFYNKGVGFTARPPGTINLNTLSGVNIVAGGDVTIDCGGTCTVNNLTTLVVLSGNLRIVSPIQLTNVPHARSDLPSLGIITSGNISITGPVKRVDAYLFSSAGVIDTCLEATAAACGGAPLLVNGFLMARDISFRRTGNGAINGATLAEVITLTPQIYLNPPALFDASVDNITLEGQGERRPLF